VIEVRQQLGVGPGQCRRPGPGQRNLLASRAANVGHQVTAVRVGEDRAIVGAVVERAGEDLGGKAGRQVLQIGLQGV